MTLDHALAQSYEHQTLTMRVHEQYLNNQGEYARLFGQLMQQQGTIFAQAAAIPQQAEMTAAVLETLASSMARFHDLQAQTLDVHRQFLAQQSDYARAAIQLLAGERISESVNERMDESANERMGESANERMGEWQPAIVESLKSKVESLPVHAGETVKRGNGNGNGHHPADATSEARESSTQPSAFSPQPSAFSPQPSTFDLQAPVPDSRPVVFASQAPAPQSLPSTPYSLLPTPQSLVPSLLAIVSDKTGYPADMLELDMDMEADLGIDSIKRVEILGALQDAHPDLPEIATDVLAELRTLRQIVERMQEARGRGQELANQRISESANQRIGESANQRMGESADSQSLVPNYQSLKKG